MEPMFVTLATFHPSMSSLKVDLHGALYSRLLMSVVELVSHVETGPRAASVLVGFAHHSASAAASPLALWPSWPPPDHGERDEKAEQP